LRLVIVRQTDNVCLVRALGEIDLATIRDLDFALTQVQSDSDTRLLVDLWDVTHIDSVGIGVLLSASRRAQHNHSGFAVVAEPNGRVGRTFDLAGVTGALSVCPSRALATSRLARDP
jgi:anti-sigma B factor antagonist